MGVVVLGIFDLYISALLFGRWRSGGFDNVGVSEVSAVGRGVCACEVCAAVWESVDSSVAHI